LRDAQQKVDDKQKAVDLAQQRYDERVAKGGSQSQMVAAENALTKAKREHRDALDDLTTAQDKYNKKASQSPDAKGGMGESFGKDFAAGIAEFFGFDGSLFKNPADFGLFKFLGAFSKLKPTEAGSGGGTGGGGSGGGGGIGDLISSIAAPFGGLNIGSPGNAPGQFMPTMPGDTAVAPFGQVGPPGTAGPGNAVDNRIVIQNPVGQDHLNGMVQSAQSAQYPRIRQSNRQNP
jgi:hypothetical protein